MASKRRNYSLSGDPPMHQPDLLKILIRHRWVARVATAIVIVIVAVITFRHIGTWLVVTDAPPVSLDAVCTFAGENVRVDYSKKLAESYLAAQWFLSDYKDGHGRILQKNNFDMSRVFITDTCKSTISEITAIGRWVNNLRIDQDRKGDTGTLHIGLVSSPYHMRRISIMANRRLRTERIRIYFLPVPYDYYPWNRDSFRHWWRSNTTVSITTSELLKLSYFMLTGYF